jgi:hypothetical protein
MIYRLFGAVGAVCSRALRLFRTAPPPALTASARRLLRRRRNDPQAIELAGGQASAPQKPGGTGEVPADASRHKVTKHKQRHS